MSLRSPEKFERDFLKVYLQLFIISVNLKAIYFTFTTRENFFATFFGHGGGSNKNLCLSNIHCLGKISSG